MSCASAPLLLTGTIASGETAVTAEIGDVLAELKIPSAAIDLDALVWADIAV
jgi:hypothetical protein